MASSLHALKPALLAACVLSLMAPLASAAADAIQGVTAVSSKVSDDYKRVKDSNGAFYPETYAYGEGGYWGGEISDATVDKIRFMEVAQIVAPPLASQNFLPSRDAEKTKLLIMVYWGTTAVPMRAEEDPLYQQYQSDLMQYQTLMSLKQPDEANAVLTAGLHLLNMANHQRDLIDFKNAGLLGYDASGLIGTERGDYLRHTALGIEQKDEVTELEENRYFVVLMAYDFQLMWKQKKHKLLWETRFSISERHNAFDKALPYMARYAAGYFGRPTHGILRERVPEGAVEVHEPTLIEFLSAPKK